MTRREIEQIRNGEDVIRKLLRAPESVKRWEAEVSADDLAEIAKRYEVLSKPTPDIWNYNT